MVARVHGVLQGLDDRLSASRFLDLRVEPSTFGGSPVSAVLAEHHAMAREVVDGTIRGLQQDLGAFGAGALEAARLIEAADSGAAEVLDARRRAVEVLADAVRHSAADAGNRDARNAHVPPGASAGLVDSDSAGAGA